MRIIIYLTECNPSEKSLTDNQSWKEIRCNKPNWKRWKNCWHML